MLVLNISHIIFVNLIGTMNWNVSNLKYSIPDLHLMIKVAF